MYLKSEMPFFELMSAEKKSGSLVFASAIYVIGRAIILSPFLIFLQTLGSPLNTALNHKSFHIWSRHNRSLRCFVLCPGRRTT